MKEIKDIINVVLKESVPDIPEGDLVYKSEVEDKLTKIEKKEKYLKKLVMKYTNAEVMMKDLTPEAAATLAVEMKYGLTSTDRRLAAEKIISYGLGKPVERVMSVSMVSSEMTVEELDQKTTELLKFFNMNPHNYKASDPNAAIYMDVPKTDDIDTFS